MALKLNVLALVVLTLGSMPRTYANADLDKDYYTIGKMEIREITKDLYGQDISEVIHSKSYNNRNNRYKDLNDEVDPVEKAGKVISVARDLVALGEDVYRLVIKGKPTNATTYAPISVVPRINGQAVDPLEVEYSHLPVMRSFQVVYENLYGVEVVNFKYSVMYSYGGSYDGKGAYLSSVQIIPNSVRTLFGYDFTATMKLGGIQNLGSRVSPVASANVLLEYTVSTVMVANNETSTFTVTGLGGFKKY